MNIVLIEDSAMDANLVKIALSRTPSHSRLTSFSDGSKALLHLRQGMAQEQKVDLTILDLNLPGMDGMEVLAECKSDPALKSMPVVVFTSSQSPSELKRCLDMGASSVVTKPAELEPFLGAVQAIEDSLRRGEYN